MTNKAKYESRNPVKRAMLRRFLRRTADIVRGAEATSVLDVGTGEGLFWQGLGVESVVGVDVRADALREALDGGLVRPVMASAYSLPFETGSFDLVVAVEILEHLQDPDAALDEIRRVARSRILITVPWEPWFSLGVLVGTGQHWRRLGREPEHINAFGPREIESMLSRHFGCVEVGTCVPWIVAEASGPHH